jgi:hypothetical protein
VASTLDIFVLVLAALLLTGCPEPEPQRTRHCTDSYGASYYDYGYAEANNGVCEDGGSGDEYGYGDYAGCD